MGNNKIIGLIRTLVPGLWGTLIGMLVAALPALQPYAEQFTGLSELIVLIAIGGFYALVGKLEPYLPDWLSAILMGSAQTPDYGSGQGIDLEYVISEETEVLTDADTLAFDQDAELHVH